MQTAPPLSDLGGAPAMTSLPLRSLVFVQCPQRDATFQVADGCQNLWNVWYTFLQLIVPDYMIHKESGSIRYEKAYHMFLSVRESLKLGLRCSYTRLCKTCGSVREQGLLI